MNSPTNDNVVSEPPTRRKDWTPTLDDAKKFRGRWIRFNDTMQASVDWSYETGWVLTFRLNATLEVTSSVNFHKSQSVEGVSWPGTWPLEDLEDPSLWRDRVANRLSVRRWMAGAW